MESLLLSKNQNLIAHFIGVDVWIEMVKLYGRCWGFVLSALHFGVYNLTAFSIKKKLLYILHVCFKMQNGKWLHGWWWRATNIFHFLLNYVWHMDVITLLDYVRLPPHHTPGYMYSIKIYCSGVNINKKKWNKCLTRFGWNTLAIAHENAQVRDFNVWSDFFSIFFTSKCQHNIGNCT